MERLEACKFELRPNGAQRRLMRRFAGSCRYVYNRALALQKDRYARGEKKLSYLGLCKELTAWRRRHGGGAIRHTLRRHDVIGPEPLDPRSGVVRVPPPARIQAGVERRHPHPGAAAQYQPAVPGVRAHGGGQSPDSSAISLPRMRVRAKCRSGRRNQHPLSRDANAARRRAGHGGGFRRVRKHSPDSLRRHFARRRGVGPGTRRSESA